MPSPPARRSRSRRHRFLRAASVALLCLTALAVRATSSGAAAAAPPSSAPPAPAASLVPAGAEIVYGSGDAGGYHLYAASVGDGWRWHPLATLQPGGGEDERWIGQQCLTGDGRTVVAIVAPWSANNSEAGMDTGALAYAVDAHTGAVRPLASGVSLAYFDPGCGAAGSVALTSYLGAAQRPTEVTVFDTASGGAEQTATVADELTFAVPAAGRILAARGDELLDITGGRARVLHRFAGQLADLHPAAGGGVDLTVGAGAPRDSIWHWSTAAGAHETATGPSARLRLFAGAEGRNLVTGAAIVARGAVLRTAPAPPGLAPTAASSDGSLLLLPDTQGPAQAARDGDPDVVSWQPGAPGPARTALPAAAPHRVSTVPAYLAPAAAGSARAMGPAVVRPMTDTTVPQCAVPRDDLFKQVWQPTADQVRWAVNQAALNALAPADTTIARPVNSQDYTLNDSSYAPLPTLYPSQQWPLANLEPSATPAVTVPPLVMYGILAQESNWDQASWHAVSGRSGDPLVADYYGADNPANTSGAVNYDLADCGYGIAQDTTGMQNPAYTTGALPAATQVAIAVDYATNIAYAESILENKWLALKNLGITMNNGDPTKLENWYAAVWGYNTGVYTGAPGDEGLGWFDNPANPIYPADRHTFLHSGANLTSGDAADPQNWPYQEKVFGWMEVPLTVNNELDYRGTYDWDTSVGSFLDMPAFGDFCGTTVNDCNPALIGTSDPCPDEDSGCWWSKPVQWATHDCTSDCITDTPSDAPNNHIYYYVPGVPEPSAAPLSVTCSLGAGTPVTTASGNLLPGTVLVDDEMIRSENPGKRTPNLMGCSQDNAALIPPSSANASFSLHDANGAPIDAAATPGDAAQIDLHQLGAGIGGHLWFTHTQPPGSANEVLGTWSATLTANTTYGTAYQVFAFVPDTAAASAHATYQISMGGTAATDSTFGPPGARHSALARTISQADYTNQWVSLGYYLCGGPDPVNSFTTTGPSSCAASVTLGSVTPSDDGTQGSDLAYNAVAFVPAPLGAYVAIGDSYSSGEGLGTGFDDGTDVDQNLPGDHGNLCHVSSQSWPRLFAAAKGLPIVDLACSGSNLWDVAGVLDYMNTEFKNYGAAPTALPADNGAVYYSPPKNSTLSGFPPSAGDWQPNGHTMAEYHTSTSSEVDTWSDQGAGSDYFAAASYQTELVRALRPRFVSVTLGGNDLGFANIITDCTVYHGEFGGYSACEPDYLNSSGPDKIDTKISSLKAPWTAAFEAITAAAGGADNVIVMTYPAPISATTANYPAVNYDCSGIVLSDRQWLVPKVAELDSALTSAAEAAGIPAANIADEHAAFAGHEMCTGTPYTVPPTYLVGSTTSELDNFFHPDAAGYRKLEQDFAAVFAASDVPDK